MCFFKLGWKTLKEQDQKENISSEQQFLDENALLMGEVRGELVD